MDLLGLTKSGKKVMARYSDTDRSDFNDQDRKDECDLFITEIEKTMPKKRLDMLKRSNNESNTPRK